MAACGLGGACRRRLGGGHCWFGVLAAAWISCWASPAFAWVEYDGGAWMESFTEFTAGEPPRFGQGWYLYEAGSEGTWRAAALDAGLFVQSGSLHTYARGGSHLIALVLRNAGQLPIEAFTLEWTGEQWTLTGASLGDYLALGFAVVDHFEAPVQLPPESAPGTPGTTVTDLPALRFNAPRFGLRWMAIDGKLEGNRQRMGTTVEGILWLPGQYLILRWLNLDQDGDAMVEQELAISEVRFQGRWASRRLEVAVEGGGRVELDPVREFYAPGEVVRLEALPDRWYSFAGWNDGETNSIRRVVIGQDNRYTALFSPLVPLETIDRDGYSRLAPVGTPQPIVEGRFTPGGPVVHRGPVTVALETSFPGGTIFYTVDGADPLEQGRLYERPLTVRRPITLRAAAYDAAFSQTAEMDPLPIQVLPVLRVSGRGGSVLVDPPEGPYGSNDTVTVTAVPEEGWTFLQWFGDAAETNVSSTLIMDRSRWVEALFGTVLPVEAVGAGRVEVDPPGPWHPYGARVRLTAVPEPGHYLAFWRGEGDRTDNPLTLQLTSPPPVWRAVFAALPPERHSLVVVRDGAGTVRVEPAASSYPAGTQVWLYPEPDPGQFFTGWDDTANVTVPLRLVMDQDRVITAHFTRRPRLHVEPMRSPLPEPLRLRIWTGDLPLGGQATLEVSSGMDSWEQEAPQPAPWGRVEWWLEPETNGSVAWFYRLGP